ncbi:MAG TPA: arabinan endo-1,5-alpha-L-arabinosidase [Bryobacteraceae bacterium]|jgi:arabinan endo-1,5-alpha-L-arabinosidase|nr:arabinan endo-1,5-alpha-L-arabinosidase [Bryobacteraceae bacterium]
MKYSLYCVASTLLVAGSQLAIGQNAPTPAASRAGLPLAQTASRGIVTRDPSTIVKCKDEFWVFYTGRGIPSFHSKDLVKWEPGPAVFQTAPEWITEAVPANRNMSYWAPDIIHLQNRYLLYYSVSSFGKMTSAIGLATTPTLDPADPTYHWTDYGIVVQSHEGGDFNTIDPSVFSDDDGTLWLAFGSYWSGIKLVQLDPKTGKRLTPKAPLTSLAYNKSIEASCVTKHDGYYYLFVNWGSCCRGVNSTYNIRVGRSRKITGPYLDKDAVDMLKGGGTLLLSNQGPLFGPGHAGILIDNGKSWFTSDFEGDSRMEGKATLAIMPLTWKSGWPEVEIVDK